MQSCNKQRQRKLPTAGREKFVATVGSYRRNTGNRLQQQLECRRVRHRCGVRWRRHFESCPFAMRRQKVVVRSVRNAQRNGRKHHGDGQCLHRQRHALFLRVRRRQFHTNRLHCNGQKQTTLESVCLPSAGGKKLPLL